MVSQTLRSDPRDIGINLTVYIYGEVGGVRATCFCSIME